MASFWIDLKNKKRGNTQTTNKEIELFVSDSLDNDAYISYTFVLIDFFLKEKRSSISMPAYSSHAT